MKSVQFTLESLFGNPPLPPNTYQLQAPIDIKKTEELFQFIYHIYKEGCIILFGTRGTFQLSDLTPERQFLMKQYMRSCGIRPRIWIYSKQDVHDVYEHFQYQVSNNKIPIQLYLQKKGRHIGGIRLKVPTSGNDSQEALRQLRDLILSSTEYINLLNITLDKGDLSLFKVSTCLRGTLYVLRFFLE